ncbi:MAG: hypothetical protein SWN10_22865 [Pseudomonadota bacterium]|nr:hypothetical protein [Pseudomonadota bacterium]
MNDLMEKVRSVNNQKSMAKFVSELADSFAENPDDWVNNDLESFLYALSAWIEDMDGYYKNTGQLYDEKDIAWKNFADMLAAATMYE